MLPQPIHIYYAPVFVSVWVQLLTISNASVVDNDALTIELLHSKEPRTFAKLDNSAATTVGSDDAVVQSTMQMSSSTTADLLPESCADETFDAYRHGSILNFFLRMQTCDVMEGTTARMSKVCSDKQFDYNEYYNVAYLVACHHAQFQKTCKAQDFLTPWGLEYDAGSDVFIRNFKTRNDVGLVTQSCNSVKEYLRALEQHLVLMNITMDSVSRHTNSSILDELVLVHGGIYEVDYSEWYIPTIPFCRNFACGGSKLGHASNQTSVYNCMPRECRGIIRFSIAFDATLAVLIIIANSLVLGVAARTGIMRNIPGYFKISLALADITVGLFVLPCCIYTTYVLYLGPMPYRGPGHKQSIEDYMPTPIGYFISFFVLMSFAVSVYTMAIASIDRYLAITKPFEYRQGHYLTKRRSAWAFLLIWIVGSLIAAFPAFSREGVGFAAYNIVIAVGVNSSLVYAVTLFIPLLAVWGLNGAMLKQVCADRERRGNIRASSVVSTHSALTRVTVVNNNKEVAEEEKANVSEGSTKSSNGLCPATTSIGYQKHEKPTSPPAKEGMIEKLKRKRSRVLSYSTSRKSSSCKSGVPKSVNVERRLARTLAIMIGAFTMALLPCIATLVAYVILASNLTPAIYNQLSSAIYLASRILLSNSFWNCIIYSIRNEHFRRAMWAIFLCKRRRIDRRLRESLSMTQMKHKGHSSGVSMNDKQSLSKSNSNSSNNSALYMYDNRRSTRMWSFISQSQTPSRKGSDESVSNGKLTATRTMSCSVSSITNGILKKPIARSESAPQGNQNFAVVPDET